MYTLRVRLSGSNYEVMMVENCGLPVPRVGEKLSLRLVGHDDYVVSDVVYIVLPVDNRSLSRPEFKMNVVVVVDKWSSNARSG